MNFREMVVNFFLSALLMLGLMSFIFSTQSSNDAVQPLIEDPLVNETFQGLSESIESSTDNASQQYSNFNEEQPVPGFGSIVLFGIVSVGKTFSSITFGFLDVIIKFPLVVLGVEQSVANTIVSMMVIMIILAVWIVYKFGG